VLADGSDGKEAVIRVVGTLKNVPFMEAFAKALHTLSWRGAVGFALAPGEEVLHIRGMLLNPSDEDRQLLGLDATMHGFFHSSRNHLFTPEKGFGQPADASWVAFESPNETSFAWRAAGKMKFSIDVSGFQWFNGPEVDVASCKTASFPYADVIVGGLGLDGLREAIRRADAMNSWHLVTGTVKDGFGAPIPSAIVSVQAGDGSLLTHAISDAMGAFSLHAPPETVTVTAWSRGYPQAAPLVLSGN